MARTRGFGAHPMVLVTLAFGIALSVLLFLKARQWEDEQARLQFDRKAEDLSDALQHDLEQNTEMLWSVAGLYAASREVEREEFRSFTEVPLKRCPALLSLEWMPRVEGAGRERFEQEMRAQGFPDFEVRDLRPDGKLARAAQRQVYFPLLYLEPFDRNRSALGFDHASHAVQRKAMEAARDLGLPVSTGRIRLFRLAEGTPEESRGGFVLFLPVYRNGFPHQALQDRRQNLAGYVAAVFQASLMVEATLQRFKHKGIQVRLYAGTREDPDLLLYGTPRKKGGFAPYRAPISVPGGKWLFSAVPADGSFSDLRSGIPLFVLAAGLVFTLLLCGIFHNVMGRASAIDRQVTARTTELSLEVNERKRLEEELRGKAEQLTRTNAELAQRERLMHSLIEGAADPIIILDTTGRIQSVNLAAEQISGYDSAELVGKHLAETGALAKASIPRALKEFALLMAGSERQPFELEIVRKGGGRLTFEVNPRLTRVSGRAASVLMIFRNVTERKHLEEEIRQKAYELTRSNEELKKRENVMRSLLEDLSKSKGRLEGKTAEVEGANRRLQEMAALKDEFVAKVSHELRTPLTSIKEGLNLMMDGALGQTSTDQQDFLRTMDGDIDRLTELINNMLDISKIESGRMRLIRRRAAVTELIQATMRSYQSIAAGREIAERFEPVPDVFIDSNRILQVLGNLFSNAVKYGREGGRITFGVGRRDGSVVVWVEDEGEGIAPEELPKLFRKFSQVGKQDRNRPRGTGLGLAVCKELVELHGGKVEAESEVGVGTRFTVHLPPYTDEMALRESFRELMEQEPDAEAMGIGVIAIQAPAGSNGAGLSRQELGGMAEEVRRRLHHADIVLDMEPCWVVALAATNAPGVQAIVQRLSQSLPGADRFRFGTALHPIDGRDPLELFRRAQATLGRGIALRPGSGQAARPDAGVRP